MAENNDIAGRIRAEIEEARRCYGNPPPNEACTCDWVIRPLLDAAGYARQEIVPQASTPGGGYPDYTILPDTPFTWYLEAKDWNRGLESGAEAIQALNYANARGHRWVVLSNGKEWLLFDNHIQGVEASQRVVAKESLDSPGLLDLLLALSKSSVTADGLDSYAKQSRLRAILGQQLARRDSDITKAISSTLRNKFGLSGASATDVALYFQELLSRQPAPGAAPITTTACVCSEYAADEYYTLLQLREFGEGVGGNAPVAIILPDGGSVSLKSWVDMAKEIVRWCAGYTGMPNLPFRGLEGGDRWFLNYTPVHANGKQMDRHRIVQAGGRSICMDVNRSGRGFVKCLCALCEAASVPTSQIKVKLARTIAG